MIDKASLEGFITGHCGLIENLDFESGEKYSMQFRLKADQNEKQERYTLMLSTSLLKHVLILRKLTG